MCPYPHIVVNKTKTHQYIHSSPFLHLYQLCACFLSLNMCQHKHSNSSVYERGLQHYYHSSCTCLLVCALGKTPQKRITKATFILGYVT